MTQRPDLQPKAAKTPAARGSAPTEAQDVIGDGATAELLQRKYGNFATGVMLGTNARRRLQTAAPQSRRSSSATPSRMAFTRPTRARTRPTRTVKRRRPSPRQRKPGRGLRRACRTTSFPRSQPKRRHSRLERSPRRRSFNFSLTSQARRRIKSAFPRYAPICRRFRAASARLPRFRGARQRVRSTVLRVSRPAACPTCLLALKPTH